MALFGGAAATIQTQLTAAFLKPAGNQQFIYTSPGGGFDFAFRLCLYTGIGASIPVILYNVLRYMEPLVRKDTMGFISAACVWSGFLALIGAAFGYFVALPSGLHFLLQGFSTKQIEALISIQSYLSFVITYLLGSALLFQLPLLLILINRIHRLKPGKLFGYQRWVILASFIIGAVISPSPDMRNQTILSAPIIFMYDAGVAIIWFVNRKHRRPKKVAELLKKDVEARAERLTNFEKAQATWQQTVASALEQQPTPETHEAAPTTDRPKPQPIAAATTAAAPLAAPAVHTARPAGRPQQYMQDFRRRTYRRLDSPAV